MSATAPESRRPRLALLALVPFADALPALAVLAFLATALALLIAYETTIYGEARRRVRHPEAAA